MSTTAYVFGRTAIFNRFRAPVDRYTVFSDDGPEVGTC